MKTKILFFFLGFLACLLFVKDCQPIKKTIEIPAKQGMPKPTGKIIHTPVNQTDKDNIVYVPQWYEDKEALEDEKAINRSYLHLIEGLEKENQKLNEYIYELISQDSIDVVFEQFKKATKINSFTQNFDDEFIKLQVSGVVRGEVHQITPFYEIKKQTLDVSDLSKNHLLLGAEIGTNTSLDLFTYKLNLSLLNKKNNLTRISFQRLGNQNFGLIGQEYRFLSF